MRIESKKESLSLRQILAIVRRLPQREKLKLSRELEKEVIDSRLFQLLKSFKTNEISDAEIVNESETVRQRLYAKSKKR